MKSLDQKATRIFLKLVEGMKRIGSNRKIDNTEGVFMPVCVEVIGKPTTKPRLVSPGLVVSVTHYHEVERDLVTDPEVTFLWTGKNIFPMTFEQGGMCYRQWVKIEDGRISYHKGGQADLAMFCNEWMRNIADQQEL
ncbi:hypothetical protein C5Y96_09940 [Blastopirellula marina]|uniref:DUF6908 domain-containing protein n=1 Tax=Blastopirellula marina TaxID=124 RepID=A0A2S8FLY0_9BACT|nr:MULTISPECIES: hypothetical protein [Pirellulaceae]PQO33171.1 hypothetical protein C5Y96_09940 [Blastopirellula marina]RCS52260.1 hypothetical protein DTL36_09950 [Bremerella cremea]